MQYECEYADLASDNDWAGLKEDLNPKALSATLGGLLDTFRGLGATLIVEETAYVDRDFSAAYASFYASLFQIRVKFCRRIHFFASPLEEVWNAPTKIDMARQLEAASPHYLGNIVIRPVSHAPVGSCIVSATHFTAPGVEIAVRSRFKVHLLGAELEVDGIPVTEQDTRTGACAQATIWAAGRHLHNRHATPWFSTNDITDAALKPTDSQLARSLPAGSDFLTADNMVRALRAMGEHPIVYGRDDADNWEEPPERTIARYVDSGIPVIVTMQRGNEMGHAVVAVGSVSSVGGVIGPAADRTTAATITHFIVNDDQRGAYVRLPVAADAAQDGELTLADAMFLIVPLPNKVFLKAEVAETLARDKVQAVFAERSTYVRRARKMALKNWRVDPTFYAADVKNLVARTYLTYGWKYKHRLMRNTVAEELKEEMSWVQLPRYVWVTEFSLPNEASDADPCKRKVRAHVVIDATGSRYDDCVLLIHLPGIVISQSFDPSRPDVEPVTTLQVLEGDQPYYPKIRGWRDFNGCVVAPIARTHPHEPGARTSDPNVRAGEESDEASDVAGGAAVKR